MCVQCCNEWGYPGIIHKPYREADVAFLPLEGCLIGKNQNDKHSGTKYLFFACPNWRRAGKDMRNEMHSRNGPIQRTSITTAPDMLLYPDVQLNLLPHNSLFQGRMLFEFPAGVAMRIRCAMDVQTQLWHLSIRASAARRRRFATAVWNYVSVHFFTEVDLISKTSNVETPPLT